MEIEEHVTAVSMHRAFHETRWISSVEGCYLGHKWCWEVITVWFFNFVSAIAFH